MARGRPKRRPYNPFAYGTPEYFAQREKNLGRRLRAQALSSRRGSKTAERNARKTGRTLERVRAIKRFAETVDRTGTLKHTRYAIRSFHRLPTTERRRIEDMLTRYGAKPVPSNVDFGLSPMGWWLFARAGGATEKSAGRR